MAISQATYSFDRYNRAGDVSVPYRENSFHILTRIPDEVSPTW